MIPLIKVVVCCLELLELEYSIESDDNNPHCWLALCCYKYNA